MAPRPRGMNPKMRLANMLTQAEANVPGAGERLARALGMGQGEGPFQWGRGTGNPFGYPQGPFAMPNARIGIPEVIRPDAVIGADGSFANLQRALPMARRDAVLADYAARAPRPGTTPFEGAPLRALAEGGVTREEAALTRMLGNRTLASSGVPFEAGPVSSVAAEAAPRIASPLAQAPPSLANMISPEMAAARPVTIADSIARSNAAAAAAGVPETGAAAAARAAGAAAPAAETEAATGLRGLLGGGGKLAAAKAAAAEAGGLKGFLSGAMPASAMRGVGGGVAGLVTGMVADPLLDAVVGGEVEDPGFSWGGLAKAGLGGAAAGGVGGAVAGGGVGALPGALIGGALGLGSYLFGEATDKTSEIPTVDENVATMQSMADQYNTDPTLTAKVVGSYRLLADLYKKNGMEDKLPELTNTTFTTLASQLGTPAPKPLLNTRDLEQVSRMMFQQTAPYIDQMSPDSPYRVAMLNQLSNFPTSLVLAGATTPQGSAANASAAMGALGGTGASGKGAALAAGLSDQDMAKLVASGIKM